MLKPGRGHWDRTLSRGERRARERARIVAATARGRDEHGRALTLTQIVLEAGVGRNTFYEHFESIDSALRAAEAEGIDATSRSLVAALVHSRTPIEQLRSLARAWTAFAARQPELVGAIEREVTHALLDAAPVSTLEAQLRVVLGEAKAAGVIGRAPDAVRVRCLTGAFLAAARLVAGLRPVPPEEMAEILVDLALRAFR